MAGRGGDWTGWIRYGLPGLAVGLGLAWGLGDRGPSARAQGPAPGLKTPMPMPTLPADRARADAESSASASGTIALTVPAGGSAQMLYLVDTRARAFAVYRVDPSNSKGAVKLEAARQYQWDLKLAEYNNQPPEVAAIESTVRSLGAPPSR